jgi:serine/threonine protein phosphatase PrpC
MQNILTRALGADKDVQVDVADHPLFPGDLVLLATDGLSKMVIDAEVAAVIAAEQDPQKIVDVLIAKSRAAGGIDNISIVAARVPAAGGNVSVKAIVSRLFGR